MSIKEFSDRFNVLLSSFSGLPGSIILDEYEKSVYLTEAQEQIVQEAYKGSSTTRSFEEVETLRRWLDSLVLTSNPSLDSSEGEDPVVSTYTLNGDLWYIVYEVANIGDNSYCKEAEIEVTPIRHDEYHRVRKNPFRGANRRRVLRKDCGKNKVELISKYPIKSYTIRYLKRPNPIILADLEDLSIYGINKPTECELNTAVHETILRRAVQLARERLAGLK